MRFESRRESTLVFTASAAFCSKPKRSSTWKRHTMSCVVCSIFCSDRLVFDATFSTVSELNELSLKQFRCHSVVDDAPPEVDPFALVADEIALLNGDVCSQLEGTDEVLTASAQHFFGAGNTREGKRVRPVIVCLIGQALAHVLSRPIGKGERQDSSRMNSAIHGHGDPL